MSHESTESMIQALSDPNEYWHEIGCLDWVACLAMISLSDEEKYACLTMTSHCLSLISSAKRR